MRQVITNPRFTYEIVVRRAFDGNPLLMFDVGMRHGADAYWSALGDQLRIIGFEPDRDECERINATETSYEKVCYPIALDRAPQRRRFSTRAHNAAASGFGWQPHRWAGRFGLGPSDRDPYTLETSAAPTAIGANASAESFEIETETLVGFCERLGVGTGDFLKVDVEGADLDVLHGAEAWLAPSGMLGVQCEFQFLPLRGPALFQDIYQLLYSRGYFLMDLDVFRSTHRAMPMPVAWDHRNHRGEPITGPAEIGQPTAGDVLMMRDLIADGFEPANGTDAQRILKAAALFEIFNLPDCAAELLLHYRAALEPLVPIEALLDQLVPFGFDPPLRFAEYVRGQQRTVQRLRPKQTG